MLQTYSKGTTSSAPHFTKDALHVGSPEANLHWRYVAERQFPPHQNPEHDPERVAVELHRVFALTIHAWATTATLEGEISGQDEHVSQEHTKPHKYYMGLKSTSYLENLFGLSHSWRFISNWRHCQKRAQSAQSAHTFFVGLRFWRFGHRKITVLHVLHHVRANVTKISSNANIIVIGRWVINQFHRVMTERPACLPNASQRGLYRRLPQPAAPNTHNRV